MRTSLKGRSETNGYRLCVCSYLQCLFLVVQHNQFPLYCYTHIILYILLYYLITDLGYGDRYKFVVQVLIGEKKDQGVRMGTKCFWDAGTDNQATENFMNVCAMPYFICPLVYNSFLISMYLRVCSLSFLLQDSIFAVATSYAIYLY